VPSPLTETLLVRWQPSLDYHLHRLDVLADLRTEGRLKEFLVRPDEVGVRTEAVHVTLTEDELALHPRGPLSTEDTLSALRVAMRCIAPSQYHLVLAFQFLLPVVGHSYDEARASAIARLSLGSFSALDFALMIDGKIDDDIWHCEVGIVSEPEVEGRLRRWSGRTRRVAGEVPAYVAVPQEIAPVSLFADVTWQVPDRDSRGDETADDIAGKVRGLRNEAERMVSTLHAALCPASLQSVTKGEDS